MDFHQLFDDLTSALDDEFDRELRFEREDVERQRQAKLSLSDRLKVLAKLAKQTPQILSVTLTGGHSLVIDLQSAGKDWILAEIEQPELYRGTALIPIDALKSVSLSQDAAVSSLGDARQPDESELDGVPSKTQALASAVGLGFILRDLGRRRSVLTIVTSRHSFSESIHGSDKEIGRIDRVGRDHVELKEIYDVNGDTVVLIPFANIDFVLLD